MSKLIRGRGGRIIKLKTPVAPAQTGGGGGGTTPATFSVSVAPASGTLGNVSPVVTFRPTTTWTASTLTPSSTMGDTFATNTISLPVGTSSAVTVAVTLAGAGLRTFNGAAAGMVSNGGASFTAVTPPPPNANADGFGPGIYWPSDVYTTSAATSGIPIASGFARFASNLPQRWFLTGTLGAQFSLGGMNGATLFPAQEWPYNHPGAATSDLTVNVTDGITTYSQAVTLHQDKPGGTVYFGSNFLLDDAPTNYYAAANPAPVARMENNVVWLPVGDGTATIVEPSGLFELDTLYNKNLLVNKPTTAPLGNFCGAYSATVSFGGGGPTNVVWPFWVMKEQAAYTQFVPKNLAGGSTIYDTADIGDVIGQLVCYSDSGIATVVPTASDGTIRISPLGNVSVIAPLTPGSKTFTARITSNYGKITDVTVAYTVVSGTKLPASNMSLAVPGNLNNYVFAQSIGTPAVVGVTGTKVWSITNPDDTVFIYSPGANNLFAIDPATGAISGAAGKQLAARTHSITVTCTDGPNYCRQTFAVPVAWKVGPTIYVGQGMAAAHPGSGVETLAEALIHFMPQDVGAYAGATVMVAANADPDYYANDNGNRTQDYALRFGIHGPVKFVGVPLNNARPRVGGHVGTANQGCDVGGKGFFSVNSGDCVIDGFEISFVSGPDESHGVSGIRKDADTYGDLWVNNCVSHDTNNGLESGSGCYHVTLTNCEIFNCGNGTVSAGATHGIYAGAHTFITITGCLFWNNIYGHDVKLRTQGGLFQNNRVFNAERGGTSNCIDIPEAGNFTIDSNKFHKGPNQQNPFTIQYGEDNYLDKAGNHYRLNNLVISNNEFYLTQVKGNRSGDPSQSPVISVAGGSNYITGTGTTVTLTGNKFFKMVPDQPTYGISAYGDLTSPPVFTETGSTLLATMPALDLSNPSTNTRPARPGPFLIVADGTGSYANFANLNQDIGSDDLSVAHNAAPGTVIATGASGFGYLEASVTLPGDTHALNPFAGGSTWSIVQDQEYFGGQTWAPVGRYVIDPNNGTLSVGSMSGAVAGLVELFKVRQTATADGTMCDHRYYIRVT